MHFRVTGAFTFVFAFFSLLSIASPLSPRTNVVVNGLDVRQLDIVAIIVEVAAEVIHDIIEIFTFLDDAHAAERYFTDHTVTALGLKYPGKNRLVFHNQESTHNFSQDAVHVHQELDIGLGFTQGYEIWVFDSGTFSLAGDGGFENYAYNGCFTPGTPIIFTKCP